MSHGYRQLAVYSKTEGIYGETRCSKKIKTLKLEIMNQKDHFLKGRIKSDWINERWIRWKNNII